ncbi:MAG: hypothetical protein L0Y71_12265 [Gemmataceae bacterium]|nr:hypothetical protein [Gemmataceae bacterium]
MRHFRFAVIWIMGAGPAFADESYYDFRKGPLPAEFTLHQAKSSDFVKADAEGLHITLPKDYKHPFGGVGVRTTFGVRGDFEITTTAEILEADVPPPGAYGVGVTLRLEKADPSPDFVNLARMVKPNGMELLLWEESIGPMNENRKIQAGYAPCADKVVTLRLKRTATTLQFMWAPGAAPDEFHEIKAIEFGADDIKSIVLIGYNGRQACNLKARFLDLRVSSPDPPVAAPAGANPAPATAEPSGRLWWLTGGGVAALAVVLALLLVARRKRAAPQAASASNIAELQCPNCQKRLKIAATAAGKKIKCPACAAAFVA